MQSSDSKLDKLVALTFTRCFLFLTLLKLVIQNTA